MTAEKCPWCAAPQKELRFYQAKPGAWVVECTRCNARGPYPESGEQTYAEAIAVWNGEESPK